MKLPPLPPGTTRLFIEFSSGLEPYNIWYWDHGWGSVHKVTNPVKAYFQDLAQQNQLPTDGKGSMLIKFDSGEVVAEFASYPTMQFTLDTTPSHDDRLRELFGR
jgi:hypothetical protein